MVGNKCVFVNIPTIGEDIYQIRNLEQWQFLVKKQAADGTPVLVAQDISKHDNEHDTPTLWKVCTMNNSRFHFRNLVEDADIYIEYVELIFDFAGQCDI
jgi:hypothetical protein